METKEQPIVLVLTREQAQALYDVCYYGIAGGNRRRLFSQWRSEHGSIGEQLEELGFKAGRQDFSGTIEFEWE